MRNTVKGRTFFFLIFIIEFLVISEIYAKKPFLNEESLPSANSSGTNGGANSEGRQTLTPPSIAYREEAQETENPYISESATGISVAAEGAMATTTNVAISSVKEDDNPISWSQFKRPLPENDELYANYLPPSVYSTPLRSHKLQNLPGFRTEKSIQDVRRTRAIASTNPNRERISRLAHQSLSSRVQNGSKAEPMETEVRHREIESKSGRASLLRPFIPADMFYSAR